MISFSGIDCSGKSTQIELVGRELTESGKKIKIIHSRGGYTPFLEFIKTAIRPDRNVSQNKQSEYREKVHSNPKKRKILLWLSIFDLAIYYGVWFRFVELFGTIIIADRYFWDSYIDFALKYPEFDFECWLVWKFARFIFLKPKISIIYTIPPELSMYRSTLKNEPWPESLEQRRARIDCYLRQIKKGRWMHVIDASNSIDDVFDCTMKVIQCEN